MPAVLTPSETTHEYIKQIDILKKSDLNTEHESFS